MKGKSFKSTKNAINTALSKLSPEDSFNIIAFCDEPFLFCTSMVSATEEEFERAFEWIGKDHSEETGTNIFVPLQKVSTNFLCFLSNFFMFSALVQEIRKCILLSFAYFCQAVDMLSNTQGSIPMVFLVTDGAVEDERKICEWMNKVVKNGGSLCPRIHTFGIGK